MPVPQENVTSYGTDIFSNGVDAMDRPDMSRGTVKTGRDIRASTLKSSAGLSSAMEDKDYDPMEGIELYFDYVTKLYDMFNSIKFVYSIYNLND
jgi:hypothetical protein